MKFFRILDKELRMSVLGVCSALSINQRGVYGIRYLQIQKMNIQNVSLIFLKILASVPESPFFLKKSHR